MSVKKDFLPELLKFLKRNEKIPILRVSREELNAVCKELEAARKMIEEYKNNTYNPASEDNEEFPGFMLPDMKGSR